MYQSSESALLLRGNRVDESAFGAPIALQGAAWVAGADPFGGDALDPTVGVATIPGNVRSAVNNTEWTLEQWCKPTSTTANGNYIIDIGVSPIPGYSNVGVSLLSSGALAVLASLDGQSWVNVSSYSGGSVPNGSWSYLEVTRRGNTLIAAVNAVDVISYTVSGTFAPLSPGNIRIGGNPLSGYGNRNFLGLLGPMRLTQGVALRGAGGPLPVPTATFPAPSPALMGYRASRADVAASAPVPGHGAHRAAPLQLARDVEHGGPGTIYGTTKTKGTPNQPAKARVVLLHQRSKLPVRETWSDPATGAFAFAGIDTAQQFLTLAEDAAGNFRPVAANRLAPEVLP